MTRNMSSIPRQSLGRTADGSGPRFSSTRSQVIVSRDHMRFEKAFRHENEGLAIDPCAICCSLAYRLLGRLRSISAPNRGDCLCNNVYLYIAVKFHACYHYQRQMALCIADWLSKLEHPLLSSPDCTCVGPSRKRKRSVSPLAGVGSPRAPAHTGYRKRKRHTMSGGQSSTSQR